LSHGDTCLSILCRTEPYPSCASSVVIW
jgi:hypothetical protein